MIMANKIILLLIMTCFLVKNTMASNFYFKDTYGNIVKHIYSNTNNYLSLHKKNIDVLETIELESSQSMVYKKDINELKINPVHTKQVCVYIKTINGIDTIYLKVMQPLLFFDIEIPDFLPHEDTLKLKYNKSIILNLYFEDNYKYITKFEDNVFIIAYVNYTDDTKNCLIVKKNSYSRYEVIITDEVLRHKGKEAYFYISTYRLINESASLMNHKDIKCLFKIE